MSLQRIPAQSGASFILKKGQKLRVRDPEGQQVADLFCYDLANPEDSLSSGRSIDYNDTIYFSQGHRLYGNSGNVFLTILEDSCGTHDFLVTPCSLQMFKMLDPACEYHPSCEENLLKAFQRSGINKNYIGTTFNIFMNVPVSGSGKIKVEAPKSKPGDTVTFLAERDLVIGLTACSDEGTNAGSCKPVEYELV
ncbi:MAG: DUF1989 domain-containing protein [Bdellovibrionota bacterium]